MHISVTLNGADVGYLIHGAPFELAFNMDPSVRIAIWNPRKLEPWFYNKDFWTDQLHFIRGKSVYRGISNYYKPYVILWKWNHWNLLSLRRIKIYLKIEFPNTIVPQVALNEQMLDIVRLMNASPLPVRLVNQKMKEIRLINKKPCLVSKKNDVVIPRLLTIKPNNININPN